MHTCIPSHGLKRSWHSYPRPVNICNKNTPSMHHPWVWNVTTSAVGLEKVTCSKILPKMVNVRDKAGNPEEEVCLKISYCMFMLLFSLVCRDNSNNNNNDNNNNNNRIQSRNSIFLTISSLCRELSPTRSLKWPRRNHVQITSNTSRAFHVQHVVLCATWYEVTAQLLNLTELKSHLFYLYFVGWTT